MKLTVTADQREILESDKMLSAVAAGRRWGKSITSSLWLAKQAWENPGSTCWYTSLSYGRALKQKRIMEASRIWRQRYVAHSYSQFPPRFVLTNGTEIAFRSLDRPDNLLGEGLAALVVDEASRVPEVIFRQVLLPMLADTRGRALLASTYNGREWFYDLVERGLKGGDDNVAAWRFPTATGIRFQGEAGKARLAALRKEFDADTWAQEFDCKPMAMSDAVFGSWILRCVIPVCPDMQSGARTVVAIDLGRVVDFTVMLTLQETAANTWTIVHAQEFPQSLEHADIAGRCREHVARFANPCIVLDTTGGASGGRRESFVRLYEKSLPGLRAVNWSANNKHQMVAAAKLLIEQKRFLFPKKWARTIEQFQLYRYKRKEMSNWIVYGAPERQHDDHVSAGIMAALAIDQEWIPEVGGLSAGLVI